MVHAQPQPGCTDTNQPTFQLLFSQQQHKKHNLTANRNIQVLLYLASVIHYKGGEQFCDHVPYTQKIISLSVASEVHSWLFLNMLHNPLIFMIQNANTKCLK